MIPGAIAPGPPKLVFAGIPDMAASASSAKA